METRSQADAWRGRIVGPMLVGPSVHLLGAVNNFQPAPSISTVLGLEFTDSDTMLILPILCDVKNVALHGCACRHSSSGCHEVEQTCCCQNKALALPNNQPHCPQLWVIFCCIWPKEGMDEQVSAKKLLANPCVAISDETDEAVGTRNRSSSFAAPTIEPKQVVSTIVQRTLSDGFDTGRQGGDTTSFSTAFMPWSKQTIIVACPQTALPLNPAGDLYPCLQAYVWWALDWWDARFSDLLRLHSILLWCSMTAADDNVFDSMTSHISCNS